MIVARADELRLENILARTECIIAIGEGELHGDALACALHSDYFILRDDALIVIDAARAWSGVIWRIGSRALRLLANGTRLPARDAHQQGLCDEVVARGSDPVEWLAGRSVPALDSAASLIARRGGDALERAEFARLFATGEPQRGLTAFLGKTKRDNR